MTLERRIQYKISKLLSAACRRINPCQLPPSPAQAAHCASDALQPATAPLAPLSDAGEAAHCDPDALLTATAAPVPPFDAGEAAHCASDALQAATAPLVPLSDAGEAAHCGNSEALQTATAAPVPPSDAGEAAHGVSDTLQTATALLAPPFDADKATHFLDALVGEKLAGFIDFVIMRLLPRDHRSIFWGDRMLTIDKSAGFFEEPAFRSAFEKVYGSHKYDQYSSPNTIAWRLHTLIWAARTALALPAGDFVECGVFKGDMAWMVGEVTELSSTGRQFHLYDSFDGFDPSQTTDDDFPEMPGFLDFANKIYSEEGLWDGVQARFRDLPHYHLHKGFLPGTLDRDGFPDRIAYLHIDLNVAPAEIACLERLFDRVVPGGVIVFDDYGWKAYRRQKDAEDAYFAARGYHIMELPTGQGLAVKR